MKFSLFAVAAAHASLVLGSVVPRDDTCSSSPSTTTLSNGHVCTKSCSADRAGGNYASSYTGTFEGCASACGSDVQCATAQFHEDNGYCYLKDTVNALDTGVSGTDTVDCCPGVFKSNGRICTPKCQGDRQGGNYKSLKTGNFDACISACAADSSCVTAQYNLGNQYCYFKDSYHVLDSSLTTSTVDCCPDVVTVNGRTCTTTCMADRAGGNYATVATGTVEGCIQACAQDERCLTAQYHLDIQTCYLKDSVNALDQSLTTDTIDCS